MKPLASILRMRWLLLSATSRPPPEIDNPIGWLNVALRANPPSPENPVTPVPATVETTEAASARAGASPSIVAQRARAGRQSARRGSTTESLQCHGGPRLQPFSRL